MEGNRLWNERCMKLRASAGSRLGTPGADIMCQSNTTLGTMCPSLLSDSFIERNMHIIFPRSHGLHVVIRKLNIPDATNASPSQR